MNDNNNKNTLVILVMIIVVGQIHILHVTIRISDKIKGSASCGRSPRAGSSPAAPSRPWPAPQSAFSFYNCYEL